MHFQHPAILLLLWILPVVAALLVMAQKRRIAAAQRFIDQPMIGRLMPELGGSRPWTKGILLLLGLGFAIVAAAQPQYGIYYEKTKQQHGVDCFVLLDVSRSMLAEDVAPNRLARAKSDIRDLLKKLGGDRVGLIVFAGKPVLKTPLTTDAGFLEMVLEDVDTQSAPRGGTLIGDAIRKALDSMPPRGDHDQILVLLTDGEDQDSFPLDAAKQAADRGVRIFTVGLGDSQEGARIPIRSDSGKLEYVKEEGKEHWSKTDQSILQKIANQTGGVHVSAGTRTYDLGEIYEDHLAGLTRGEEEKEVTRRRFNDQYQVFLAVAFVLLLIDRWLPVCSANSRCVARSALLAMCVFSFTAGAPTSAEAAAWGGAAQKVNQGIEAFHARDYKSAAEAFGAAAEASPDEPRIAFDHGCVLAAQGEYDKAVEQFQIAMASRDRHVAAAADYNLGCTAMAKAKAKLGQKPEEAKPEVRKEVLESLEQAFGNLRDCLAIESEHADARYNLEALQLWKKHIQEVWRQRDIEKRRQEMNLVQFLQWLEKEQRDLRAKARPLSAETSSPKRREAIRALENAERELADEIKPLKEKIHAALTPEKSPSKTSSATATQQPSDSEVSQMSALLDTLADDAHNAMNSATDTLAEQKLVDAGRPQADAIEKLDSISMAVLPFFDLVKKGIAIEEGLLSQTKNAEGTNNGQNGADWNDAAWNQRLISNHGRVLAAKAKRELEQLAKAPAALPDTKPVAKPSDAKNPSPAKPDGEASKQPNAQDQQKETKRALQAGIDLAPKVVKSSNEAAMHLEASKPAAAVPAQEETLRLLKEMLPKQDQNKDQNKDQKDQKNQDNKDKQKNKQDKKDKEKDKDKAKKDQEKKDQEKKDQNKKDQKDQQQQKKSEEKKDRDQQQQAEQRQDPTKQQAEAAMRKVRQRQQDRREQEKALLEKLYRPDRVDKDW